MTPFGFVPGLGKSAYLFIYLFIIRIVHEVQIKRQ